MLPQSFHQSSNYTTPFYIILKVYIVNGTFFVNQIQVKKY